MGMAGWSWRPRHPCRDAMEIQYRVFGRREGGGGGGRIKCPGETLETRWGHFFLR